MNNSMNRPLDLRRDTRRPSHPSLPSKASVAPAAMKRNHQGFPVPPPSNTPHAEPPKDPGDKVELSADLLVKSVNNVVSASVTAARYEAERQKLQKKIEQTDSLVKRAKANPNFPITSSFYQQSRAEEDKEKAHIDEMIKAQSQTVAQLERDLKSVFSLIARPSAKVDDDIAKLRAEFDERDSKLRSQFNGENAKLRAELNKERTDAGALERRLKRLEAEFGLSRVTAQKAQSSGEEAKRKVAELSKSSDAKLPEKVTLLQNRVLSLERATNGYFTSINTLTTQCKGLEERFESQSSPRDTPGRNSRNNARGSNSANDTMPQHSDEWLRNKMTMVEDDMGKVFELQRKWTTKVGHIEALAEKYDGKFRLADDLADKVVNLEKISFPLSSRLAALEKENRSSRGRSQKRQMNPEINSALKDKVQAVESRPKTLEEHENYHSLDGRVGDLSNHVNDIFDQQAMKDELLFSEVEEVKMALGRHTEETATQFETLRSNCDRILADSARISDEMKTLSHSGSNGEAANHSANIQQVEHTVGAIKVALRSLETRYNNINTEPIVKNMVVAMNEMYPSAGHLIDQVAALRMHVDFLFGRDLKPNVEFAVDGLNRLSHSLPTLWGKVEAQENKSVSLTEDLQRVQNDTLSTTQRLDKLVQDMEEGNALKKADHDRLLQTLNHERERLNTHIETLSKELKSLVAEVGGSSDAREMQLKDANQRIDSLLGRLAKLERAGSQKRNAQRRHGDESVDPSYSDSSDSDSDSDSDSTSDSEPSVSQSHLLDEAFMKREQRTPNAAFQRNGNKKRKRQLTNKEQPAGFPEGEQSTGITSSLDLPSQVLQC